MRPVLSLVLPIFNEEEVILELAKRLEAFRKSIGVTTEVVFIDDGSKDASLKILRRIAKKDPSYRVLSFSRNLGTKRPSPPEWITPRARRWWCWTPTFRIRRRSSSPCWRNGERATTSSTGDGAHARARAGSS